MKNLANGVIETTDGRYIRILDPKDPDEATAEILYMFFNRRSCVDEPFQSRVNRVVIDTMATKQKVIGIDPVPHIRISNFLAPRGIDLNHHHYVVMDGLYYTFLYIKGNGYPSMVRAGWMSSLINAGEGVDVDVFLRRENRSKSIDKVAQRIRLNRTKLKSIHRPHYKSAENEGYAHHRGSPQRTSGKSHDQAHCHHHQPVCHRLRTEF